ncbi:MAG: N-acetyltransferase family protein [Rhodobacteraceae bacterium]|uniref:GNAT family N-acetyltransferase n=1 Tax=Celeribacter sp. HF31 TaxID=2721558 RepID=UPI0014304B99|nr:GNAT family N-acetyltransferase [Celeribacter sp. HF31]NIY78181.1 N-acetyltransferase [Celeribacter sp. HF31]NVK46547.1 N-acetyltransferase family protein [Paracoccaceae bacterium]
MSDTPYLRDATPADADALKAIMAPVIAGSTASFSSEERDEAAWAEMVTDRLNRGRAFYVAEHQGEVVGYATYDQFRPGNNGYRFTMEHSVYLNDAAQGFGLGRTLMLMVEQHAREAGHHSMIAAIDADNAGSIAFHKALGYAEAGRIPQAGFKFDRWLDVLFLQKFL